MSAALWVTVFVDVNDDDGNHDVDMGEDSAALGQVSGRCSSNLHCFINLFSFSYSSTFLFFFSLFLRELPDGKRIFETDLSPYDMISFVHAVN